MGIYDHQHAMSDSNDACSPLPLLFEFTKEGSSCSSYDKLVQANMLRSTKFVRNLMEIGCKNRSDTLKILLFESNWIVGFIRGK